MIIYGRYLSHCSFVTPDTSHYKLTATVIPHVTEIPTAITPQPPKIENTQSSLSLQLMTGSALTLELKVSLSEQRLVTPNPPPSLLLNLSFLHPPLLHPFLLTTLPHSAKEFLSASSTHAINQCELSGCRNSVSLIDFLC